jgi:hypothetical protein
MLYWLSFILILVTISPSIGSTSGNAAIGKQPAVAVSTACLSERNVSSAVQRLSSPLSDPELVEVKKVLFGSARRSQKCRKQVIAALITAMDKPNLDLLQDPASFDTWNYGAKLLGELKAAEALDLLITHLNITDGLSSNMNHYPAVGGVITMGPVAIPKLAAVLRGSSDPYMRRKTVFCIASIGGPAAMRALKKSQSLESDRCNSEFIRASIKALDNKRLPNQITSEDRLKWYSTFLCHD